MFKIGDYAVCPGHGVGRVRDIETRELGTETKSFYVLAIISNGMTVMVPTDSTNGIRGLVDGEEIDQMYGMLGDHEIKIDNSTWNRRHREYTAKIKTGSLLEIADVLRSLFLLKNKKNLSFGEKKMLDECRVLITEEVALSKGDERVQVQDKIDSFFQ